MNFHIVILVVGSLISMCSLISVFYVPWIHVKAPISKGFYDIHVFLDVGLLQCFSEICKKYSEVEYFLEIKLPRYNQYENITSSIMGSSLDEANAINSNLGIKLPKLPNFIELERSSLEKFINHFQLVSKVAIFNISISIVLLLIFFLLFSYDMLLFHMIVLFPKLYDTLLLMAMFFYSVATLSYVYMTISLVDEGRYSTGIWISGYTCLFGLICCFLANLCPGWHTRARLLVNADANGYEVGDLSPLLSGEGSVSTSVSTRQQTHNYGSHQSRESRRSEDMERGAITPTTTPIGFRKAEIELSPTTQGGDSRFLIVTS